MPPPSRAAATRSAPTRSPKRSDKRGRILDAAAKVFASRGYFNSTVAEIARAAGVADGTIYLYVDNKEDLLFQLFEEKMSLLVAQAEAALAEEPDAPARLRRFVQLHFQLVETNPEITKVLIVELRQSELMRGLKKQKLAAYLELVAEVVREGQASRTFHSEVSPATMKRAIFGALDEIALGWLLADRKTPLERTGEEIATLFVRGLLARPGEGATAPKGPPSPKSLKSTKSPRASPKSPKRAE